MSKVVYPHSSLLYVLAPYWQTHYSAGGGSAGSEVEIWNSEFQKIPATFFPVGRKDPM